MKIIDDRKKKFTKPDGFADGDIVLDATGVYYKIHFDCKNFNHCLEDLSNDKIVGTSKNIAELLKEQTTSPLIRIKSEDTELHIKWSHDDED